MEDGFSNAGGTWTTSTGSDFSVQYERGGLHFRTFRPEYFAWSNPDAAAYQDVHLEVTVRNVDRGMQAGIGIVCDRQASDDSYYYFAIKPNGEYIIAKSVFGREDIVLSGNGDWMASDRIARNAPNYHLGADCGFGTLTLYVDGKQIDSVRDTTYHKGEVGLFLWSGQEAAADVLYDDFVMTRLK